MIMCIRVDYFRPPPCDLTSVKGGDRPELGSHDSTDLTDSPRWISPNLPDAVRLASIQARTPA